MQYTEFFAIPDFKPFKEIIASSIRKRKKCIHRIKHERFAKSSWARDERHIVLAFPPLLDEFCFVNIEEIALAQFHKTLSACGYDARHEILHYWHGQTLFFGKDGNIVHCPLGRAEGACGDDTRFDRGSAAGSTSIIPKSN